MVMGGNAQTHILRPTREAHMGTKVGECVLVAEGALAIAMTKSH